MACSMGTGKQPAMGSLDVPRRDSPATNVSALMTNVECSFPTLGSILLLPATRRLR